MDDWGWEHLRSWLARRTEMPLGALCCVIGGPTAEGRGAARRSAAISADSRARRAYAGGSRPTNCATPTAVEMAREGVPLNVIQRQLGHADLGVTSIYLQGIDNAEVINAVHARRAPMMPVSAGLRL
jgi:integrase